MDEIIECYRCAHKIKKDEIFFFIKSLRENKFKYIYCKRCCHEITLTNENIESYSRIYFEG